MLLVLSSHQPAITLVSQQPRPPLVEMAEMVRMVEMP
jgi:hypothetical protein